VECNSWSRCPRSEAIETQDCLVTRLVIIDTRQFRGEVGMTRRISVANLEDWLDNGEYDLRYCDWRPAG